MLADVPIVSVVIPTFNRPKSLARLLRCVAEQDLKELECIVVDDGSDQETTDSYNEIWRELDDRFRLHLRSTAERGSGPSAARNRGVALARGKYIAFCDDDDRWIRTDHLSTATTVMSANHADLFFANMQGRAGESVVNSDYYGPARVALQRRPVAQNGSVYHVSTQDIAYALQRRTLHADTLVVEKALLIQAGLYWAEARVGEDADIGFRLADRARKILFRSELVAELDAGPHKSIVKDTERSDAVLLAVSAIFHAETSIKNVIIRRAARRSRAWYVGELAQIAASDGKLDLARRLCLESLLLYPGYRRCVSFCGLLLQKW